MSSSILYGSGPMMTARRERHVLLVSMREVSINLAGSLCESDERQNQDRRSNHCKHRKTLRPRHIVGIPQGEMNNRINIPLPGCVVNRSTIQNRVVVCATAKLNTKTVSTCSKDANKINFGMQTLALCCWHLLDESESSSQRVLDRWLNISAYF